VYRVALSLVGDSISKYRGGVYTEVGVDEARRMILCRTVHCDQGGIHVGPICGFIKCF